MVRKYYNLLMRRIYKIIPVQKINIEDLFSKEPTKGFQMVVAVRYLFVEYCFDGDCAKLELYNRAISTDYRKNDDNEQFYKLIKSIQDDGFKQNSAILMDRQKNVIDGTHRLAASIYLGNKTIFVRQIPRNLNPMSLSKRVTLFQLSKNDLEELNNTYNRMINKIESKGEHDL